MFSSAKRIGLTVDHTGVRYAEVKKKKKGWEIERAGFLPFEAGLIEDDQFTTLDDIRKKLKHWVKEEKLGGASVSVAIPTSQVIIRKLSIGSSNAKELDQLIDLEVETALHLPFHNPVYDYIAAGSAGASTDVLIFASPQKWIQECISLLEDAGLKVKQAELSSTALARAIKAQYSEPLSDTMLFNIEETSMEVYMFHNDNPVFMRVISEYEQDGEDGGFSPQMVASINSEVARLLSFYQYSIHDGSSRIVNTIATGKANGREQLLNEFMQAQPEMQVETIAFANLFRKRSKQSADDYRIPFGLAIREKTEPGINLLPEKTDKKRNISTNLIAAGLIWVLCLGGIGFGYMNNTAQIAKQKETVQTLGERSNVLIQQIAALNAQSKNGTDPQSMIQTIKDSRQDSVYVLDELANRLPSGAAIQTAAYSKPGEISMTVLFNNMDHMADYLVKLRAMDFAGSAQLQSFITVGVNWSANYRVTWKQPQKAEETALTEEGGEVNGQ